MLVRAAAILTLIWMVCDIHVVQAAPVRVRLLEGTGRAFLIIRSVDGEELGYGEFRQKPLGSLIDSRLTLHFKDGSLWDETCVFSQRGVFRLERYHHKQEGPSFPSQTISFDRKSGRYDAVTQDKKGDAEEHASGRFTMPADLYNGMATTLLRNVVGGGDLTYQTAVFSPKPRLIKTVLHREGEESATVSSGTLPVIRYLMKLELGGLAGLVAPLIGKEPPDVRYWMVWGDIPLFLRFEGALFLNGPVWRMEQVVPRQPETPARPGGRP